jgi:diguanylate cyclase (GGDEF)-like protein/PAS domain S-box-containing protein
LDLHPTMAGLDAWQLVGALSEAVLLIRDGRVEYANQAACALAGDDPTGRLVADLVAGWDTVRAGSGPIERSLMRTGGEPLPVQIRTSPVPDGEGSMTAAVLRDARELVAAREAEIARFEAEARYRALVEEIPAVVYADEGGEMTTYVSPQIEHILGVTQEQYKADPDLWISMVHPDDRATVEAESDAFLAGRGGDLSDYRMVRPDGRIVWVRDRAFAVRDRSGRVLWEHGLMFDVTELKEAEARIAHMAFHDALTGLANRALFEESLGQSIERAKRHGLRAAVLFLDLDNFKVVNDSLGHHAGDALLIQLAQRLSGCTRDEDLVARQGGDEFLMLLGDLEPGEAIETAQHVARRVEAALTNPFEVQGVRIDASASIGVSMYPADALDPSTLMQHADSAMYRAKRAGSGAHAFWSEG